MDSIPSSFTISRPLRTYEGIWKQLRFKKKVVLELIDISFYTRIKKMVIKEKSMDKSFARENVLEGLKLFFSVDEEKKELTIQLVDNYTFWNTIVKNRFK